MANRKPSVPALGRLDKVYIVLLLIIFGGIVVHAPFSVGLGVLLPDYTLVIKAWKEILMGIALVLGAVLLYRHKKWTLLKDPLVVVSGAFVALHLLLLPFLWQGLLPSLAGLLIDLRFILFFVLVYIALRLYPATRRLFLFVGLAGALVVLVFALLQVFVLPVDMLKYLGYSQATIVPYLTVDQNHDFIRILSTLRGPNPLGAYAGLVLSLLLAFWLRGDHRQLRRPLVPAGLLIAGGLVALWASYSRSAWLAAGLSVGVILIVILRHRVVGRWWLACLGATTVVIALLLALTQPVFVSNVVLHEDPVGGSAISSNEGHVDSLQDGIARVMIQPLGAGVGSTGSASLLGDWPLIIENQYLFIAHEAGWTGLVLFGVIFVLILRRLWHARADWLALGVFASGLGLAAIGLFLPVWVDDTIAIIWWGLAAVALGGTAGLAKAKALTSSPK